MPEHNYFPYKLKTQNWDHIQTKGRPCGVDASFKHGWFRHSSNVAQCPQNSAIPDSVK